MLGIPLVLNKCSLYNWIQGLEWYRGSVVGQLAWNMAVHKMILFISLPIITARTTEEQAMWFPLEMGQVSPGKPKWFSQLPYIIYMAEFSLKPGSFDLKSRSFSLVYFRPDFCLLAECWDKLYGKQVCFFSFGSLFFPMPRTHGRYWIHIC